MTTCPECKQELADNQVCPCSQTASVVAPNANDQGGATAPGPTPPPPGAEKHSNPPPGNTTNVEFNLKDMGVNAAGGAVFAGVVNNFKSADESHKVEEEKSLHDLVKQLFSRETREYNPPEADLKSMVTRLLNDRLILISSSFAEYANDTAWEVIDALPDSTTRFQRTRVAFEDAITKNVEFSLQKLCEPRPDSEKESVLLVDALNAQADIFPTSILSHSAHVDSVKQDLQNNKLFLIVIVNHEYATKKNLSQSKLSYRIFSYWNIPFLEPFFQGKFEDHEQLLAELAKQRQEGKWEERESDFTQQILNYHQNDRLIEVINSGGPTDPDTAAETLLKKASPVEKTVLYAASFFDDITSPEFCRVVESLLGTRTMSMTAPEVNANGSTPGPAKVEVPLRRIWDEEKDEIFTSLLVETTTSDSPRTISLSEFNLVEPLRKLFEKRHRFYLMDQFRTLEQTGIFFYLSLRVAKSTTQIAVKLANIYPDEFDEGWIVALVMRIRAYFAQNLSSENEADDSMFRFLSNTQPGASNHAFARVSDICQRFLELPQQKRVVPNTLEYLLKTGYDEEVLWLIKQFKFSSEFDDWYWLKQLLHRSKPKTRYFTYFYILSYLKQMGARVYDGLERIEKWLPPREGSNHWEVDSFIFCVLIRYCLETVANFNLKHHGKWPSRYPLFKLSDQKTAEKNLSMMARCLLHPCTDRALPDLSIAGTRITLVAVLLAEWSFILLGPKYAAQTRSAETPNKDPRQEHSPEWSATQLFDLLLKQFLDQLDLAQRLEVLKYWNFLEMELFRMGAVHTASAALRQETTWKSEIVQRLLREIRNAPLATPSVTNIHSPLATGSPV